MIGVAGCTSLTPNNAHSSAGDAIEPVCAVGNTAFVCFVIDDDDNDDDDEDATRVAEPRNALIS